MKKRRIFKRTLTSIGAFVLVFYLLFGLLPISFTSKALSNYEYKDVLSRVYRQDNSFGEIKISNIAMLGAHDSLSYGINYLSKPNVNEENPVNNNMLRIFAKGAIVRLSKAQNHDVYTQLNYGVRYIDARITCINGNYYNSHGLLSGEFKDNLLQILKFLKENKGEFIIFHIVHYYEGESNFNGLCEFIANVKDEETNKNLFDYVLEKTKSAYNYSQLTYNDLTENGTESSAILVYGGQTYGDYKNYFSPSGKVYSHWNNDASSKKILTKILETVETAKGYDDTFIKVNQTQTTPNANQPFATLFNWSLVDTGAKHNSKLIRMQEFDEWLNYLPIYLCDNSTTSKGDFNHIINEKIIAHNLSIC